MEASTALTDSMRNVTAIKLSTLSKQQKSYETQKHRTLDAVATEQDPRAKVKLLLDAFDKRKFVGHQNVSRVNLKHFLEQCRHDPSISASLLSKWQASLEQDLDIGSRRYEHAALFGRLVMQWLQNRTISPSATSEGGSDDPFENIGRKEMHEQRTEWESIVFAEGSRSDPAAIQAYLDNLFGSTSQAKKSLKTPLETMRETMKSFKLGNLDPAMLETCATGILKTDLLSEAKRKTLAELRNDSRVLQEIADVLNMQIDTLEEWSWGDDPIPVEVRRSLNGKYRVHMDSELLSALLLHYVGLKWGVHMRDAFFAFFRSGAWRLSSRKSLDREARQRRREFLTEDLRRGSNLRNRRRDDFQEDYFMSQLPASFETDSDSYNITDSAEKDAFKSRMSVKQSLLHLLSTEALVNTRLHGSFTVLQSDFKWFGPSMPHATIVAVLHFFGVSEFWLRFFEKFLEAPIKFVQDGPHAATQVRRSGVPIQHRLSDALGEAVLFCLDFAVNKSTQSNLYRLHDDIWFWGAKDNTILAWQEIQRFSKVMGLRLNGEKTGSIELTGTPMKAKHPESLPSGPISWGFLKLGSSGQWIVDNAQIESHTKELRTQLQASKSIFAFVQAWNVYVARFIPNNFGESANCLGRTHVEIVTEAFGNLQKRLFASDNLSGGSVVAHLRNKLVTQFGVDDIPDGFFYFPVELGGLGLINPLVPLNLVHESSMEDPMQKINEALELDEEDYEKAKKAYLEGSVELKAAKNHEFMTLEEYTTYREETSRHLYRAYVKLLQKPRPIVIEGTPEVQAATPDCVGEDDAREAYDEWIRELYGPEIVQKYGGLAMSEKKSLPIGLFSLLSSEKIKWQD
ncbi:hypothetical protein ACLMJK_000938 [Lecanora helva]